MGHEFEITQRIEVEATPEQVWNAIATGEGVDCWFIGRNRIEPGDGGEVRTDFGELAMRSQVTAWQPPERFAHRSPTGDDGRFIAYEFLVEGRAGSGAVVRLVTSGFLPGDDWHDEYEAMSRGLDTFVRTLAEYLTHFYARPATPVTAFGPPASDWPRAWRTLRQALGLGEHVRPGDPIRWTPPDAAAVDGTVYLTNPHALGIRTADALYRFLRGFGGQMIASHHLFTPTGVDPESSWRAWLLQLPDRRSP
jgi:uncharacterized protein YndB with AHSA1/START domain